jgi:DNA modification methylase
MTGEYMLIQGDANDVMLSMGTGEFDMVITSPPFKEEDVAGDYWKIYDEWWRGMMRVASKVVCVIHSATKLNHLIAHYPPKRTIVWGKGISCYAWRWNPILVYQISDDYKVNKFIWSDSFGVESVTGQWKVHKYQDPDLLYETIIKMFVGCNTVLDPFCGSGTTGRACAKLQKAFTGIDLNADYIELTKKRLDGVDVKLF